MKSTAMRKLRLFSAVLSLFLLVPASIIWAQNHSQVDIATTGKVRTFCLDSRAVKVLESATICTTTKKYFYETH